MPLRNSSVTVRLPLCSSNLLSRVGDKLAALYLLDTIYNLRKVDLPDALSATVNRAVKAAILNGAAAFGANAVVR